MQNMQYTIRTDVIFCKFSVNFEWRFAGGPIVARDCMLAGSVTLKSYKEASVILKSSKLPCSWFDNLYIVHPTIFDLTGTCI